MQPTVNITCDYCGIGFHKKPSHIKKVNYCSKKCHNLAQFKGQIKECANCGKENMNQPGHSKGHKAPHLTQLNKERNPKLALEADAVRRGDYKSKEHRKVMEKIIGRKLKPWEDVHHKNGIHDDNSPENLEVLSHSEHLKLHWRLAKERGVI